MLGFLSGLAVVVVGLVLQLVVLEGRHVPYDDVQLATFQMWVLMVAPVAGTLVAYAGRS